jgi:hypothetical protein
MTTTRGLFSEFALSVAEACLVQVSIGEQAAKAAIFAYLSKFFRLYEFISIYIIK